MATAQPRLFNPELGQLNDFKNFLYMVWMFLPDIQKAPTRIQYDIADFLQYSEKPWTIMMAYRGVGKSYITAAFVVWLWLINPRFNILVLSASEDKAKDFAHLVRQIISGMDICEHLRARPGQRDSTLSFDVGPAGVSKDPSLNVYGINGQITGGRADFIIPDDIETPDNSNTVAQREKLQKKLDDIIAIIKPATTGRRPEIKMLGTPQTEQSIYFGLEPKGYSICVWPARYPTDITKYADRLSPILLKDLEDNPRLAGKPINPEMHSEEDLSGRALGRKAWFLLQYMLDPSLSDEERYPLKLKDFMVMHVDPTQGPVHMAWAADERVMVKDPLIPVVGLNGDRYYRPFKVSDTWKPYQHKLLAIDPAGGNDETAYVVLYFLMGFIFIAAWGGLKGGLKSDMDTLAALAQKHGVDTVLVERNFGAALGDDGEKTSGYTELLRPVLAQKHRCSIKTVHVTTMKEKRICDDIEIMLGAHRLVLSEDVIKEDFKAPTQAQQGLWQLTHITRDRGSLQFDDRADVLALGVKEYISMVQADVDTNEAKIKEEDRDDALTRFMRNATHGQFQAADGGEWLNLDGNGAESVEEALMEAATSPWWETINDD